MVSIHSVFYAPYRFLDLRRDSFRLGFKDICELLHCPSHLFLSFQRVLHDFIDLSLALRRSLFQIVNDITERFTVLVNGIGHYFHELVLIFRSIREDLAHSIVNLCCSFLLHAFERVACLLE